MNKNSVWFIFPRYVTIHSIKIGVGYAVDSDKFVIYTHKKTRHQCFWHFAEIILQHSSDLSQEKTRHDTAYEKLAIEQQ